MNQKNISIGVVAFLVLVVFFSVLKVRLVGSPALALRMGEASYIHTDKDSITVLSMNVGDEVKSPLTIVGNAKGSWYYEGSFPVLIYDENRNAIGRGMAIAQTPIVGDEIVPFVAIITFDPSSKKGTVVFSNDNPSGDSRNFRSLSIPVSFDN